MKTNVTHLQPAKGELLSAEKAFEWPYAASNNRNWPEAAKRWAVLRKAYPNDPATWFHGANAHMQAGELEEAERVLGLAQQHFPNHPNILTDSASLAMQRKNWNLAEDLLQAARERHPSVLQTWMKSAEYAEAKGDFDLASQYYRDACQCSPDRPAPFLQYAELAMRAERWEEACKRWKDLRDRFPDLPAGYHRAAESARRLGRTKEARRLTLSFQYGPSIFDTNTHNRTPSRSQTGLTAAKHLLELIWIKALFGLRSEVHQNYLSYGWWILEPVLHMAVYYVVFGIMLQYRGGDYPVFLLTGLIPWMWFMKAVSISSTSILNGQGLMLQAGVPSVIFPLVSILQASLKQIPTFVLLFGFVWLLGYSPSVHWWALIPIITVQMLLTTAFSGAIAALIPFARDLTYLVPTGLTFLMFLSGIFYDYHSISPEWQDLFLMNPIAFLLKSYREVFIDDTTTDLTTLMWWGVGSGIACILLALVYRRLRYIYPRIIIG